MTPQSYAAFRRACIRWDGRHGEQLMEEARPPERLLQAIWLHQRLKREALRLVDGRRLRVLHPGFWNHEAGPDFRGAHLWIEGAPPFSGDVEVEVHARGWKEHGHERNPDFEGVVLHVVWEGETGTGLPELQLLPWLDTSLEDLSLQLAGERGRHLPAAWRGLCCHPLGDLGPEKCRALLEEAALTRLEARAAWMTARAREVGWHRVLLEALFRGLGYKQNVWPMQRLAELVGEELGTERSLEGWQALLFGLAGFLSQGTGEPLEDPEARLQLRRYWDLWWRERGRLESMVLPSGIWSRSVGRPWNHPQRRLALGASWLAGRGLVSDLEAWFSGGGSPTVRLADLKEILGGPSQPFWEGHSHLRHGLSGAGHGLIGSARVTDLALNAVLPWLWARATAGGSQPARDRARDWFLTWPSAQDNATLKTARQRLFGPEGAACIPKGTAGQQGLLQIVRDFCRQSNASCSECLFPELAREWGSDLGAKEV